jgi:uncharacterized lipoprotein NlpE involved in copper resistance
MKSIIKLSAITVLAALTLVGCNQNAPNNSTEAQSTNSSASDASAMSGAATNATATNSVPDTNTNAPGGTNQ